MTALPKSLADNPRLDRWLRFAADGTVHVGSTVLRPFANRNRTSPAAVPVGNAGVNDVNIDDPDVCAELTVPNV